MVVVDINVWEKIGDFIDDCTGLAKWQYAVRKRRGNATFDNSFKVLFEFYFLGC